MSKKILGLLLVICLVVGLLPVVASAAAPSDASVRFGFSTYKLSAYDTPIYFVNASRDAKDTDGNAFTAWGPTTTGATAENYNAKFEWKTGEEAPILTLRGFKFVERNNESGKLIGKLVDGEYTSTSSQAYPITFGTAVPMKVVITADSEIAGQFGITYKNDTTIVSEGDAKLVMSCVAGCIVSNDTNGAGLTIDANLDLTTHAYYNTAYGGAVIRTYGDDLVINGGNISCKNNATKSVAGMTAANGGNVIINGGNIAAHGAAGLSATNGSIQATSGKVIINAGTVAPTAREALPIYGQKGVEINGGIVNIVSPFHGINAGTAEVAGDIVINGGTLEITAAKGAFYKVPVVGSKIEAFAGPSESEADYYDETKYRAVWVKMTDGAAPTAPTTAPTAAPTQATQAPTQATQATEATQGGQNPGTGDNSIAMFAAMMLVAVFGIVAVVGFGKKRAA